MTDMERTTLHIVGGDSRSRAEQARIAFALGHHAEVYGDLGELIERPPDEGLILAADEDLAVPARMLVDRLSASGIWLPMMLAAHEPTVERAVEVIKAGALDYLALPLEMGSFARRLGSILGEAEAFTRRRRREIEARHAIGQLSRREREVLELLSEGCSNKEVARNLSISPRTVEIHRGNMMAKLGAGHAADAVRLWMDGCADGTLAAHAEEGPALPGGEEGIAGRIGEPHGTLPPRVRRFQRQ